MNQHVKRPKPSVVELHPKFYFDLPEKGLWGSNGVFVKLVDLEYGAFGLLVRARTIYAGGWYSREEMAKALYEKKDRKPDDPIKALEVVVCRVRAKIRLVHNCECVIEFTSVGDPAYRITAFRTCTLHAGR